MSDSRKNSCAPPASSRGAIKVSGFDKVHAILGGFHLMPMPGEFVHSTVTALKEFEPDYLVPMHWHGVL
ncbi:MAG: hypothetical protein ACYC7B_03550 [Burkholderiales bacterium]